MRILARNQEKIQSISVEAFRMLIIENVINRRKELKKSQADMAKALQITPAAYNKLENGKTKLSDSRLHEFSEVLEISLNELLGLDQIISVKAHDKINELEAKLIKSENKIREVQLFNDLLQKQYGLQITSDTQIVILHEILSDLMENLKMDSSQDCFIHLKPLKIKFELSYYIELERIKSNIESIFNKNKNLQKIQS